MSAAAGDQLKLRPECKDWFLFPSSEKNEVYCDLEPCADSTGTGLTSRLLMRMGRDYRGFSTFWKGLVTRAMILALIDGKGKTYDAGLEQCLVRLGGWDIIKGFVTV